MRYRTFETTDGEVSDVRHEMWGLAGWNCSNDRKAFNASNCGVEIGCNFYDTARDYGSKSMEGE